MMNILIEYVPDGTAKDMLIEALTTGNKKNIVFDTTKEEISFTKYFSDAYEVSQRSVQEGISRLIRLDLVTKLNKYQYMLNHTSLYTTTYLLIALQSYSTIGI